MLWPILRSEVDLSLLLPVVLDLNLESILASMQNYTGLCLGSWSYRLGEQNHLNAFFKTEPTYTFFKVISDVCLHSFCWPSGLQSFSPTQYQIRFHSTPSLPPTLSTFPPRSLPPSPLVIAFTLYKAQVQVDQGPQHKTKYTESNRRESGKEP